MTTSGINVHVNDNYRDFYAFKYVMDISRVSTVTDLKKQIIAQKAIHPKYNKKLETLADIDQIKDLMFAGVYPEETKFEGIATIISSIVTNDKKKLMKYVFEVKLGAINLLRIIVNTLSNIEVYSKSIMLYRHLKLFKLRYEPKFKDALFEIGQKPTLDKFDLLKVLFSIM